MKIMLNNGFMFDYEKQDVTHVTPDVIAKALSKIGRYAGHSSKFYSVAEHCVRLTYLCPPEHKFAALMHDATEIFVSDIPSPVKTLIPAISMLESSIWLKLAEKFNLPKTLPAPVHKLDAEMCIEESMHLLPRVIRPEDLGLNWPCKVHNTVTKCGEYGWPPNMAYKNWLECYRAVCFKEVA